MRLSPPRLLAIAVGGIVLALALVVGTVTLWLPPVVEGKLTELGYERARVGGASLALVGGRLELRNISAEADGRTALRIHDLALDWDWPDIGSGGLRQVALSGGLLRLERGGEGQWWPAGIPAPAVATDSGSSGPPPLAIDLMDVRQLRIEAGNEVIAVDRVQVTGLDGRAPDHPLHLKAVLAMADGDVEAGGRIWAFAQAPRYALDLGLDGLDLARLLTLLPSESAPRDPGVTANARIQADLKLSGEGGSVTAEGPLNLSAITVVPAPDMKVTAGALRWTGRVEADAAGPDVTLDGALAVESTDLSGAALPLVVNGLSLDWKGQLALGQGGALTTQSILDVSPLSLDLPEGQGRLELGSVRWDGAVRSPGGGDAALDSDGALTVGTLALERDGLALSVSELAWRGRLDRAADGAVSLDGQLRAAASSTEADALAARVEGLDWRGRVKRAAAGIVTLDGTLAGARIETTLSGPERVDAVLLDTRWTGDLSANPVYVPLDLNTRFTLDIANSDIDLSGRAIRTRSEGLSFRGEAGTSGARGALLVQRLVTELGLDRVEAGPLRADGLNALPDGSVDLERLGMDALRLVRGGDEASLASVESIAVGGLKHRAEGTELESVDVLGLLLKLRRGADGEWVMPVPRMPEHSTAAQYGGDEVKVGDGASANGDGSSANGGGGGPRIRIGRVSVGAAPNQDTALQLDDQGVEPPAELAVSDVQLILGEMDSAAPRAETPLDLKARFGEHGRIAMAGTVRPFEQQPVVDLKGGFTAVDLIAVSPYLGSAVGYRVRSGSLDAATQVKVAEGKLDVENDLTLYKFAVREVEQGSGKVPLPLALNVLKDVEGNVKLALPVTGDASSPDFDLSDVVSQAMGTALTQGVLLYVQPLGSVLTVGKLAMAASVAFNPATFPAGGDALDADNRQYLAELAEKLKGRPQLRISVCGVATEADRVALAPPKPAKPGTGADGEAKEAQPKPVLPAISDAVLIALAERRAATVREVLSGEGGVSQDQLVVCAPEVDGAGESTPRVDLGL